MPSIDMPLDQLRQYKPSLYREEDFESFWDSVVRDAVRQPINAELIPYNCRPRGWNVMQCGLTVLKAGGLRVGTFGRRTAGNFLGSVPITATADAGRGCWIW